MIRKDGKGQAGWNYDATCITETNAGKLETARYGGNNLYICK